jgi:hypothetical protein
VSIQRDPHLPPPEVCDWLLAQRWSEVVPTAITTFPAGGPSGITKHEAYDSVYGRAALGANEVLAIEMPVEALQLLEEDAWIRREAIALKRRELMPDELARKAAREQGRAGESEGEKLDPETTLLRRVLADAEQADISAFSAIGVLTTAATMMVSQCYDLTKLGDDHADA